MRGFFAVVAPMLHSTRTVRLLLLLGALWAGLGLLPAADAEGRHFLWRVSKDGQTLYLLGSVHVLRAADYPLPQVMEDAFKGSEALVEEIDLSHFDAESAALEMMQVGRYQQGESLKSTLPPAVYQRVVDGARKLGLDTAELDPLRPWLASISIEEAQLLKSGFDPAEGVDRHFAAEAATQHKPVIGLEEPEYQIGLMAKLPDEVQQEMLLQSLSEAAALDGELKTLLDAWHAGDAAALEKILKQDFGDYPQVYRPVVVDRNLAWAPKLEQMSAGGKRYFVVVGALHLVGPDGLLARFEKDGYKVEQL
jgi:uncharacterized protein YbaP (TraB family)